MNKRIWYFCIEKMIVKINSTINLSTKWKWIRAHIRNAYNSPYILWLPERSRQNWKHSIYIKLATPLLLQLLSNQCYCFYLMQPISQSKSNQKGRAKASSLTSSTSLLLWSMDLFAQIHSNICSFYWCEQIIRIPQKSEILSKLFGFDLASVWNLKIPDGKFVSFLRSVYSTVEL